MKNLKLVSVITVLFLLVGWFSASAQVRTNVRGVVMVNNAGARVPVASIKVDLYSYNPGAAKWVIVATTYTDGYGFYYFKSVAVGYYSIQVNGKKNFEIQVIPIDPTKFVYQDLAVFIL
jgi:hypothetical protein